MELEDTVSALTALVQVVTLLQDAVTFRVHVYQTLTFEASLFTVTSTSFGPGEDIQCRWRNTPSGIFQRRVINSI